MSYIPYCMAWDEEREIKQRSNIEAEYELPYKEMVKSWTIRLVSGWCGIELSGTACPGHFSYIFPCLLVSKHFVTWYKAA